MQDIINILSEFGIDRSRSEAKLNELAIDNYTLNTAIKPFLHFIKENFETSCSPSIPIPLPILNYLSIGVVIIVNKKIKYINDTLERYLGDVDMYDVDYSDLINLIHSEDRASYSEYIFKLQSNIEMNVPLRVRTLLNDLTRWVELKAHKVIYKGEAAIQVIILDISNRVFADVNNDLMQNIARDVDRKRLIADKLMEQNARIASIGLIASGLIHEINQPLNAIRIGVDGLLIWDDMNPGVFSDRVLKIIRTIAKASGKIDELVKQLQSYRVGNSERNPEHIVVNQAILRAEKLLGQKMKSHDVKFELNLDESIPLVWADNTELELIINNLIINSIKAFDLESDNHNKYITITTKVENDAEVLIEFVDNGSVLTNISSELEYNGYSVLKSTDTHYSIELLLVKLFVTMNLADIKAYSNAENGTNFIIRFRKYSD